MSCPKNPKRFLWLRWFGDHRWAHDHEGRFGWRERSFEITVDEDVRKCDRCGVVEKEEYRIIEFSKYRKTVKQTGRWIPYDQEQPK